MKFLVFGCNGMSGHMISLYMAEQGHDVTGFAKTKSPYIKSIVGDATDLDRVRKVVSEGRFDAVINCIGLLNQFADRDHAGAVFLNSYLPHFLADITSGTSTQIIHLSTDCVFSGKTGNYTENSFRDGSGFYDRTKALGELEDEKNITLRNSIVGPDIKKQGIGLLNWFMQQHGEIDGYTKSIWTGQTTLQLARTIEKAAEEHIHGLYNAVPDSSISKYELLNLFNRYMRNNELVIHPVQGIIADKTLIRTKFDFTYTIPDYGTMVEELSIWMKNHRNLYPHYNFKELV